MAKRYWFLIGGVLVLGLVLWMLWPAPKTNAPTMNSTDQVTNTTNTSVTNLNVNTSLPATITFSTADIPDRDAALSFMMDIPTTWRAEYVSSVKAMNLYLPKTGATSLTQSQVFVTTATGSEFSIPSAIVGTVTNGETKDRHATRQYTVTTGASTSSSKSVPAWWSEQHVVVQVAKDTTQPTTYTSFHFAPTLSGDDISALVGSLQLGTSIEPQ